MKPVVFIGDSLYDLRAFPERARRNAGFQLDRVQRGLDADDWKPMQTIGPGVREIRVRDSSGAFRVVYVATFVEAVYVLHAFAKKTQRTSPRDLALAQSRFRELKRGAHDEKTTIRQRLGCDRAIARAGREYEGARRNDDRDP